MIPVGGALAIAWTVLASGASASWLIGLPAVLIAAAWHIRHAGETEARIRPLQWLSFAPWFLRESVLGGVAVARLAFASRRAMQSGFERFPMRVPEGPARRTFANVVSLLPGTLSTRVEGDTLLVHRLGTAGGDDLTACEARVAPLFVRRESASDSSRGHRG